MLRELSIKGFILIDDAKIPFQKGFNAITGETGAGKSILVGAVDLILGANASTDYIQPGKERALVQAVFDIERPEVLEDLKALDLYLESEEIIITRQILENGRNQARINDEVVTLSKLRQVGELLIDIHGQNEHQSLLKEKNYLGLIDAYLGEEYLPLMARVATTFSEARRLSGQLRSIEKQLVDKERRLDLLDYQIDEIEKAALTEEDNQIDDRFRQQMALTRAQEALGRIKERLAEDAGILDLLGQNLKELRRVEGLDPALSPVLSVHENAFEDLQDGLFSLQAVVDGMDQAEETLQVLEKRLDEVNHLKRKYGHTVEDIQLFLDNLLEERTHLQGLEDRQKETEVALEKAKEDFDGAAAELTERRKEAALSFERAVENQLGGLKLEQATLSVGIEEETPSVTGVDRVEILISTNKGLPLRPLKDVVSGGELSRIMLAVKNVLGDKSAIGSMIFDEIDAGISGLTAQAVAQTVYELSQKRQIIAITHLPQIAVMADHHLMIEKREVSGRTVTSMVVLGEERRQEELNRLLNGDLFDETAKKNIENLMKRASEKKKTLKGGQ